MAVGVIHIDHVKTAILSFMELTHTARRKQSYKSFRIMVMHYKNMISNCHALTKNDCISVIGAAVRCDNKK